jgi:hypothetical protein
MKQLKAAFEQLERDIERDTGDELRIEADCGSGGKFAEFYYCSVYLKNNTNTDYGYMNRVNESSILKNRLSNCKTIYNDEVLYNNFFHCSLKVRVKSAAESIFYEYDVSPGKPR